MFLPNFSIEILHFSSQCFCVFWRMAVQDSIEHFPIIKQSGFLSHHVVFGSQILDALDFKFSGKPLTATSSSDTAIGGSFMTIKEEILKLFALFDLVNQP